MSAHDTLFLGPGLLCSGCPVDIFLSPLFDQIRCRVFEVEVPCGFLALDSEVLSLVLVEVEARNGLAVHSDIFGV